MNRDDLIGDLTPFCDIGTGAVKVTEHGTRMTARLTRDTRSLKLVFDITTGKVESTWGSGQAKYFASFAALLASDVFANLRRWSDVQQEVLRREIPSEKDLLPVRGTTHHKESVSSLDEIDDILGSVTQEMNGAKILVIDGPAGIGKTSVIEQLALKRAVSHRTSAQPLILHVKSRGRVLSNLQDLMAFSLQTIRSQITYDQIPVLTKHGLVVIAIDGFDELADPNGYETAWSQLGELVVSVRGKGTIVLAGRDTFIGRNRLVEDVEVLRDGVDIVSSLTLEAPSPDQAKTWLKRHQWTEANFESPAISVLLEDNSFALRPVFLRLLAEHIKPRELKDKYARYLTPLLVDHMIRREAGLFGRPVQAVMNEAERIRFVSEFLCEVARSMADSQTESMEATELSWISEAALGDGKPADIVSLIRNRASVVAFFINDERPGYRTFMHSHFLHYFVALVTIDVISRSETPKFIRRNLFGAEFLSVFTDVVAEMSVASPDVFSAFWSRALNLPFSHRSSDRGLRNIGALVLATLPSVSNGGDIDVQEFQIDDAVIRGACPNCAWTNVAVKQLDCRGSDLSLIRCSGTKVENLIADDASSFGPSFPIPKKIILADGQQVVGSDEIAAWLGRHGQNAAETVTSGLASVALRKKPIYELLRRVARVRQYWLREDSDDVMANKIINDPEWPTLSKVLTSHDYLREEVRQAAGRASKFYHVKHRESILAESKGDENLKKLFEDLQAS
jgi:hypothetical protein